MKKFVSDQTILFAILATHASPKELFVKAEHLVVDPMIAKIKARQTTLKCPP
jgi:hypothetical protein